MTDALSARKAIPPELRDLDAWPTVDASALSEDRRKIYERRAEAVRRYARGESLVLIYATTGIQRGQLYKLIARCTVRHPDGRMQGFRGLRPHARTQSYVRTRKCRQRCRQFQYMRHSVTMTVSTILHSEQRRQLCRLPASEGKYVDLQPRLHLILSKRLI